jgi:hypothetical protein
MPVFFSTLLFAAIRITFKLHALALRSALWPKSILD